MSADRYTKFQRTTVAKYIIRNHDGKILIATNDLEEFNNFRETLVAPARERKARERRRVN